MAGRAKPCRCWVLCVSNTPTRTGGAACRSLDVYFFFCLATARTNSYRFPTTLEPDSTFSWMGPAVYAGLRATPQWDDVWSGVRHSPPVPKETIEPDTTGRHATGGAVESNKSALAAPVPDSHADEGEDVVADDAQSLDGNPRHRRETDRSELDAVAHLLETITTLLIAILFCLIFCIFRMKS